MKIIIVGCGKVGVTIARRLSVLKTDVTVIDISAAAVEKAAQHLDVLAVRGNGLNERTLISAGAPDADLLIAVTHADETNILLCISAKFLGTGHTIARVRDPEYGLELNKLWEELGIDMLINPEQQTARQISRLLRYSSDEACMPFAQGKAEMVSLFTDNAPYMFEGKTVGHVFGRKKGVLAAYIIRRGSAIIPADDTVMRAGDELRILGRASDIMGFIAQTGKKREKLSSVMVIGGGKITFYLVEALNLHAAKYQIKIIEIDKHKCDRLAEALSEKSERNLIINGDGLDEDLLLSEDIESSGAVVCLTDKDEDNIIISLYAKQIGIPRRVAKINHLRYDMVKNLALSNIVNPQDITSEQIMRYVKGLLGAKGASVLSNRAIFTGADKKCVYAVEITVFAMCAALGAKLKDLKIKSGVLPALIIREDEVFVPADDTQIALADKVIIITNNPHISEIDDILA